MVRFFLLLLSLTSNIHSLVSVPVVAAEGAHIIPPSDVPVAEESNSLDQEAAEGDHIPANISDTQHLHASTQGMYYILFHFSIEKFSFCTNWFQHILFPQKKD